MLEDDSGGNGNGLAVTGKERSEACGVCYMERTGALHVGCEARSLAHASDGDDDR